VTGQQIEALRDALCAAFDQDSLHQMLRVRLDKNLADLVGPGGLRTVVFNVIDVAVREGWQRDLIRASLEDNPGNPALRRFCEENADLNLGAEVNTIALPEIARRLGLVTTITAPLGGLTWQVPEGQRQCIHQLVAYLEDRSFFFKPFEPLKCSHSPFRICETIEEIRKHITTTIQRLPSTSQAIKHLKRMRSACHRFLIKAGEAGGSWVYSEKPAQSAQEWGGWYEALYVAIGELRSIFGVELAELCLGFNLEPDRVFLDLLPLPDPEDCRTD
jgi:hypothetical protein